MKSLTAAAIGVMGVLFPLAASAQIIHQSNALVITSPLSGTVVNPGETITVSVTVNSGTYPKGIAIVGGESGGPGVTAGPVAGTSPSFSVTIPANANPGPLTISADGMDSSGNFDSSFDVSLDVERTDIPVSLRVSPPSIPFQFVGESIEFTVMGAYGDGSWHGLTQSSLLQVTSNDTAVVVVKNGAIIASGPGTTTILVTYGTATTSISVSVPNNIRGM